MRQQHLISSATLTCTAALLPTAQRACLVFYGWGSCGHRIRFHTDNHGQISFLWSRARTSDNKETWNLSAATGNSSHLFLWSACASLSAFLRGELDVLFICTLWQPTRASQGKRVHQWLPIFASPHDISDKWLIGFRSLEMQGYLPTTCRCAAAPGRRGKAPENAYM